MPEQFTHGYALLIGVNQNQIDRWALPEVAKDIVALTKVLTHPERCAYPAGNVKTITGPDATRQGILDGLDWLQDRLAADSSENATAIVYYSGHGWRDTQTTPPDYYLIPYDMQEDKIRSRALRATAFAEAIDALQPQRLLVVLDCCHAGGMGVKDIPPAPAGYTASAMPVQLLSPQAPTISAADGVKGLEVLSQGAGRAVLSSSQGDQPSYNRRDRKMGIFTYHLIEALTGHAQPQEGATEVLVSDVMSYVWRHVPRTVQADWGRDQQPDYQVSGNFPVALLLGGKGLTAGQPAPDPLTTPTSKPAAGLISQIHTGGGAYVGGSVDTGGGDFVRRDKHVHGDEVRGDKVGGDKITTGDVSGTGIAIGRGAQATVSSGLSGDEINRLFAPILEAVRQAPPEKRDAALDKAEALKDEATKGQDADDTRMANLIDDLVDLVPDAVSAVVSTFATPVLGGIAGPITHYVLSKIKKDDPSGTPE